MFSSTLKERYRWLLRLGSSAPCCLQCLLMMTAPSYMILSATVSTNNLPDFDFPTFLPDVWSCCSSCCSFDPKGRRTGAAAKAEPFRHPSGTIDRHQKGLWKGNRPFTGHCQQIIHTNQWTYCIWMHVWRFPFLSLYLSKDHSSDSAVVLHL